MTYLSDAAIGGDSAAHDALLEYIDSSLHATAPIAVHKGAHEPGIRTLTRNGANADDSWWKPAPSCPPRAPLLPRMLSLLGAQGASKPQTAYALPTIKVECDRGC